MFLQLSMCLKAVPGALLSLYMLVSVCLYVYVCVCVMLQTISVGLEGGMG